MGPEHPNTAETLYDFAMLHKRQRNHQGALALYQRALAIREQALGQTHPQTRATRERLTALWERVGREGGAPSEDDISPEQGEQRP